MAQIRKFYEGGGFTTPIGKLNTQDIARVIYENPDDLYKLSGGDNRLRTDVFNRVN
jgi:hypothetical protein